MEIVKIKSSLLSSNTGQIEGLPANPREWEKQDIDRIKRSIAETPELFEMRPCLVYEHEGKFVILGGNLRFEGAKRNRMKEIPCIVIPPDTSIEKMKEIVIKDNGSFGNWDMDLLESEWDDVDLAEWGVDIPSVEENVQKIKKEKDEDVIGKIPFSEVLNEEHNYIVLYFDNNVDWLQAQTLFDIDPARCLPTKDGGNGKDFNRIGVGRVLRGAEALDKLINFSDHEDKH